MELGVELREEEEAGVEGVGVLLRLSESSETGLLVNNCLIGAAVGFFTLFPPLRISLSGSLPLRRRSLERELLDSLESES
jgi:hypothetical protein